MNRMTPEQFAYCYTHARRPRFAREDVKSMAKPKNSSPSRRTYNARTECFCEDIYDDDDCGRHHENCELSLYEDKERSDSFKSSPPPMDPRMAAALSELRSDSTTHAALEKKICRDITKAIEEERKADIEHLAKETSDREALQLRTTEIKQRAATIICDCESGKWQVSQTRLRRTLLSDDWVQEADNDSFGSWDWKNRSIRVMHSKDAPDFNDGSGINSSTMLYPQSWTRVFFSHLPQDATRNAVILWLKQSPGKSIAAAWTSRVLDADDGMQVLATSAAEITAAIDITRYMRGCIVRAKVRSISLNAWRDAGLGSSSDVNSPLGGDGYGNKRIVTVARDGLQFEGMNDMTGNGPADFFPESKDKEVVTSSAVKQDADKAVETENDERGTNWRWRRWEDREQCVVEEKKEEQRVEETSVAGRNSSLTKSQPATDGIDCGDSDLAGVGDESRVFDMPPVRTKVVQKLIMELFDVPVMKALAAGMRIPLPSGPSIQRLKVPARIDVQTFMSPLLDAISGIPSYNQGANKKAGERLLAFVEWRSTYDKRNSTVKKAYEDSITSIEGWGQFLSQYLTSEGVAWSLKRAIAYKPEPFEAEMPLVCFGFDRTTARGLRFTIRKDTDDNETENPRQTNLGEYCLGWLGASISTAFGLGLETIQTYSDVVHLALSIAHPVLESSAAANAVVKTREVENVMSAPSSTALASTDTDAVVKSLGVLRKALYEDHTILVRRNLWIPNHFTFDAIENSAPAPQLSWLILEMLHLRMGTELHLLAQLPVLEATTTRSDGKAARDSRMEAAVRKRLRTVFGATIVQGQCSQVI